MDLPRLDEIFSSDKNDELFLALKIESNEIKSAVWSFVDGEAKVLALGERQEWGEAGESQEELMVACDSSIATAVAKLKEENRSIPRRLVVGLPYSWIEEEKIKKEKLEALHFVTKKLTLTPLGFVVTPEAIVHYLKKREKDFSAAILVYLGTKQIEVTLIDGGKVVESQTVGRSDSLALDVEEGILRFENKNLPARILLYNNGEDLEAASQTLIAYPWQPPSQVENKAGFFHLPRVEILPENFEVEAIVFAGGEEYKKSQPKAAEMVSKEETPEQATAPVVEAELPTAVEAEVEFVEGEDILANRPKAVKTESEVIKPEKMPVVAEINKAKVELQEKRVEKRKKWSLNLQPKNFFKILVNLLKGIFWFPKKLLRPGSILWVPILFLLGILVTFGVVFYLAAKTEVILTLRPKIVEKSLVFRIDDKLSQIDTENKVLPARSISAQVSGSRSAAATGKKTVGEKAKGEVTIYNRTDSVKKFNAGTILIGPGKLEFSLDTEAKVASKSPDPVSHTDHWGEGKASITALDIGAQYNIAAGSQFSFENLSTSAFSAENQVAFLGGTSRQITVVAKEDQEKLLADLTKELNQKAKTELESKISAEENLALTTLTTEVKVRKFDHEVAEEVSDLTLNLTIENQVLVFKRDDLLQLALGVLTPEEIGRLEIDKEQSQFEISPTTQSSSLGFVAKLKMVFRPKVDQAAIVEKIKGTSLASAQRYLSQLDSVKTVKIITSPGFFKVLSWLPFKKENIMVSVVTE